MASVVSSEMGLDSYRLQIIIFFDTCFLSHLDTCTCFGEIKKKNQRRPKKNPHLITLVSHKFIIFNKLQIGDQNAIYFLFKMILICRDMNSLVCKCSLDRHEGPSVTTTNHAKINIIFVSAGKEC